MSSRRSNRWVPAAAIAMAAIGAAAIVLADVLVLTTPGRSHSHDTNLSTSFLGTAVPFGAILIVGLLLSLRRPANPVGWLLSTSLIAFAALLLGTVYTSRVAFAHDLPAWPEVPLLILSTAGWSTSFPTLFILLPLVFPDGHVVSRRWRRAVWLAVATISFTVVTSLLAGIFSGPNTLTVSNATGFALVFGILDGPVSALFMLALIVAAVVSLVIRYRRAGSDLRHQLKWFIAAMAVAALAVIPTFANLNNDFSGVALTIGLTVIPVTIGIAVLRYRLYDIDVIISRALVYGALAAFISAIYIAIVVGIGTAIGSGGKPNLALSILATAVVAVGFQPVRERLQKIGNRLVYGKRATPYEVLAEFSGQVGDSYAADDVLPRMARVLQEGTAADYATVWLRAEGQLRPAATSPDTVVGYEPLPMSNGDLPPFPDTPITMPVLHQDELLGALTLAKRQGEALTPIEEKLLHDLAGQAGLVFKNVRLTADLRARLEELRASRQRLVSAQDAERRRLERNLHDGAQQHLVALKVKIGLAETLAARNPGKAEQLIEQLEQDTSEALDALRDLARGIYPPLLADQGLAVALESHARKATIPVTVEAIGVRRYPQELEAAVYFCCLEALQNVQKYARATQAVVHIRHANDGLEFEVKDDGVGFDPATTRHGSGLTNMSDRIAAVGGNVRLQASPGHGTSVSAIIPVESERLA